MTNISRNILLAIGALALITGVIVGVMWLRGAPAGAPQIAQSQPTGAAVLVTLHAVQPGALLRQEDVAWKEIGDAKPPANSFARSQVSDAELVGAVARRSFAQGEVLTADGVLRPNEKGFLAATLGPGFRAVTIPIDAPQSASGLIQPGDRIDVILVQQLGDNRARSVGETILGGARVVAIGRTMNSGKPADSGQAQDNPKTLTIETSPIDAERILLAGQIGKLEIALRPAAEPQPTAVEARPVWIGDVSPVAQFAAASAAAKAGPATAPASRRARARSEYLPPVVVIRGSKSIAQ